MTLFDVDALGVDKAAHEMAALLREHAAGARAEGQAELELRLPGNPVGDAIWRAAVELLADPHIRIIEED